METNVVVLAFFIARPNFRLITLKLWFSYDFFHGNAVFILFIVTTMYKRNRQPLNQFKWFFVVRCQWTVISMRGISFESIYSQVKFGAIPNIAQEKPRLDHLLWPAVHWRTTSHSSDFHLKSAKVTPVIISTLPNSVPIRVTKSQRHYESFVFSA